jgi:uncharacterized SAM-dependent methyltransferase
MPKTMQIAVHASQFPENVRAGLLDGLRARQIAPKYLYQSYKQAQLWMRLHRACSPAWTDPDASAIYEQSFTTAALAADRPVHLIGLGCGSGYKEARLLRLLAAQGYELSYVPCDVSLPLLITAAQEAQRSSANVACRPLLCDLAQAPNLTQIPELSSEPEAQRIVTFFGMMPNFEPDLILPKLANLLRAGDSLLLSANLSPGADYRAGMQRVMSGYDNPETRQWLLAFLYDLGLEPEDGFVDFSIEEKSGLLRFVADYHFFCARTLVIEDETFEFAAGDAMRVFFSYRHTPGVLRQLLHGYGLEMASQWINASGEEGVFLCRKQIS